LTREEAVWGAPSASVNPVDAYEGKSFDERCTRTGASKPVADLSFHTIALLSKANKGTLSLMLES
jgi:hypothetical protein